MCENTIAGVAMDYGPADWEHGLRCGTVQEVPETTGDPARLPQNWAVYRHKERGMVGNLLAWYLIPVQNDCHLISTLVVLVYLLYSLEDQCYSRDIAEVAHSLQVWGWSSCPAVASTIVPLGKAVKIHSASFAFMAMVSIRNVISRVINLQFTIVKTKGNSNLYKFNTSYM